MSKEFPVGISEIKSSINCDKDFLCITSEFKQIGKARDIGLSSFVECLERLDDCRFQFAFGNKILCSCPLRVYIAKKLKK